MSLSTLAELLFCNATVVKLIKYFTTDQITFVIPTLNILLITPYVDLQFFKVSNVIKLCYVVRQNRIRFCQKHHRNRV